MNTLTVLSVWVLTAAGIQLGTLWIMKLSILPMLNTLPYDRYVTVCQLIDMHVFHPIAVWSGVLAAGLGVWAAVLSGSALVSTFFVIGSVGMVVVGIASEGFNRPIWRQIEQWSPRRVAERWNRKRYHWHIAHQVRTYAAITAVAAYVVALLAQA
ncbi:hypothetical protein [Plantactinospora sp. KBS50]|uniref:hypothetical protein n=1 Tax=Plantactinospora sp. KBS50 TaxID=2024580 RepID=UPI000BAAB30A|nr:hypothetical protein [Plantactinospora sp. KBS50]ASW56780.1 hypothetical protein CIK06_25425 [Plantactinospora sp. KBS50]